MAPTLLVAIHPRISGTRILAASGPQNTVSLQATLSPRAAHPRALPWLLESLALWEGKRVRAALVADEAVIHSRTSLFRDLYADLDESPLFTVELMPTRGRAVARADFRDLHVLLQAIRR